MYEQQMHCFILAMQTIHQIIEVAPFPQVSIVLTHAVCLQFNISMAFSCVSLLGSHTSNLSRRSLLYIIPLGGVSDGQLAEILVQDTEK